MKAHTHESEFLFNVPPLPAFTAAPEPQHSPDHLCHKSCSARRIAELERLAEIGRLVERMPSRGFGLFGKDDGTWVCDGPFAIGRGKTPAEALRAALPETGEKR